MPTPPTSTPNSTWNAGHSVALDAAGLRRHFVVAGGTLSITGLTLENGAAIGARGIAGGAGLAGSSGAAGGSGSGGVSGGCLSGTDAGGPGQAGSHGLGGGAGSAGQAGVGASGGST